MSTPYLVMEFYEPLPLRCRTFFFIARYGVCFFIFGKNWVVEDTQYPEEKLKGQNKDRYFPVAVITRYQLGSRYMGSIFYHKLSTSPFPGQTTPPHRIQTPGKNKCCKAQGCRAVQQGSRALGAH